MTHRKHEAATPQPTPAKVPDMLLQRFDKQCKEIEELKAKSIVQTQLANMKKSPRGKKRDKKPIMINIELEKHEHDFVGKPLLHRVAARDAFLQLSIVCISTADVAFRKAGTAATEGRFKDYFGLFAETERCLGAAVAWSSAAEINSLTATHKSKGSRAEIDVWKKRVLDYWRKHIDPTYSADKAAEIIDARYLSETGKEITLRTLAKWVSAEKKTKTLSPPEVTRRPIKIC